MYNFISILVSDCATTWSLFTFFSNVGDDVVHEEQCILDEMFSSLHFWEGNENKCVLDAMKIGISSWVRLVKSFNNNYTNIPLQYTSIFSCKKKTILTEKS